MTIRQALDQSLTTEAEVIAHWCTMGMDEYAVQVLGIEDVEDCEFELLRVVETSYQERAEEYADSWFEY